MKIEISGAREHNLQDIDVVFDGALTVVTGVSGSGKSSLVFDTLYHEARRRFLDIYSLGSITERLTPAKVRHINGLRPAIAVGQDLLNRNPNSTVASASGLSPLFRLLYARYGERACPHCGNRLEVLSRAIIARRLVDLSIAGPIRVTAPLIQGVSGSHTSLLRFLHDRVGAAKLMVDGQPLPETRDGAARIPALDPEAKHSIDLELGRFEGTITETEASRLTEKGTDLGAWALRVDTAGETRLMAVASLCGSCGAPFTQLEPVDFARPCPHCAGEGCAGCDQSGLEPEAASVRWSGRTLRELCASSVAASLRDVSAAASASAAESLIEEILKRLRAMQKMGLGYLGLDRPAPTLSRGEGQRLRLAVALVAQLDDLLYILDEPTIGQHPADVRGFLPMLRELPGQVVIVEHDRQAASVGDQVVDLGPGAGSEGGRVIFSGSPEALWQADTATGRHFSLRDKVSRPSARAGTESFITLRGVRLRNLQDIDVPIPGGRLTVVTGVSGSGKSTLVEDVLTASMQSGAPVGCQAIDGQLLKAVIVDQKPIGKNPRSNPATYTKLSDILRELYAANSSLPASNFSFNRHEGACPDCKGMGAIEVRMRYLPSTWIECASCEGKRFSDETLAVSIDIEGRALSIADFYELPVAEALSLLEQSTGLTQKRKKRASSILKALIEVGLGYLTLGQPSPSLSGGEAQRLKLARVLGGRSLSSRLLVLDEPTTGLHPHDTANLLRILDRLVDAGATVVVVEHNLDLIRAADWIVDLGPGAGPDGGRLIYAGPLSGLLNNQDSSTAEALRSESAIAPRKQSATSRVQAIGAIKIRNARAHNLQGVDVDIPKDVLTVVTGRSGAGKSSLLNDVLENEARRRFLESLSLYERQGSRPGPEVNADLVSGTGVVVTVAPDRTLFDRRSTVGTATEISFHLAVLLAWLGRRECLDCQRPMRAVRSTSSGLIWQCTSCQAVAEVDARHFSPWHYAAACLTCNGVGTLQIPNPDKLIANPDRPLCNGAMYSPGFFPKGYMCKPFNGGYDMLQALAGRHGFDPFVTPWNQMPHEAREAFLYGDPEPMDIHFQSRNQSYVRRQAFPGFYGFIRDWDVGGTYTDTELCPDCAGARLRREYLATTLADHNYHGLSDMDLVSLAETLERSQIVEREKEPDERVTRPAGLIAASRQIIGQRLRFLAQVGLGYLNLNRLTSTLSAGEAQRIKLAGMLGGNLSGLTILLDEPTRGLHPSEVQALLKALCNLRDQGNCVIVVEHDLEVIRAADHVIEVGPGAGRNGGYVVAQGTPTSVASSRSATGRWLREDRGLARPGMPRRPTEWLSIDDARANNLRIDSVAFPKRRLVGICGVSGSGKSTLVVDTLGRALAPKKHTTSVASEPIEPGRHGRIMGAPSRTVIVDQARAGVPSPASFLGLDQPLRKLYADSELAQELGLQLSDFRRNCQACKGRSATKTDLGFLPPLYTECVACNGTGYAISVSQVRIANRTLPEIAKLTIAELLDLGEDDDRFKTPRVSRPLQSAKAVGLEYLVLRQPGYTLSGGEAQRLKIARELGRKSAGETLYIFDEPSLGQHMEDLQGLINVLGGLVEAGHSVIVVEHHAHILAACDWLIELGPGGGQEGGRVIFTGEPQALATGNTPMAPYLKAALARARDLS